MDLFTTSLYGHTETCQLLISSGANVNEAEFDTGRTPLYLACLGGHTEHIRTCELLISSGANVNQSRTDNGITPLWIAVLHGHTKTCQLLISSGANVNQAKTYDGSTPLSMAYEKGRIEIYHLLNNEMNRRQDVSIILLLERTFNSESLFHEENLPLDLFKLILIESYLSL